MSGASSAVAARRLNTLAQQLVDPGAVGPQIERNPSSGSSTSGSRMLEGQVAIITGAGKGIGEAAAKLLASQGAAITVCDLDAAAAQSVVSAIKAAGGRAIAVAGDVTAADAPERIVKATVDAFGRIDILVNNAGFTWDSVIHKTTPEQWQMMLDVHCTAPFRLIQAATPHMRDAAKQEMEGQGQARPRVIVNISSTSGTHGNAGQANYATAKAGVVGLTKAVAKEWGMFNIRCNAIAFGLIGTRLVGAKEQGESIQVGGKSIPLGIPGASGFKSMVKQMTPLQRMGTVEDAAGAIMMMCSPWSAYITGQVIEVHGGSFM